MWYLCYVWINGMFDKRDIALFSNMPQHASKYIRFVVQIHSEKSGQFLETKEAFRIHLHFPWFPIHASEFLISALLLNRLNTQRTSPHSKEWMNAIPPSVQCLEVGTQFVWLMIFMGIYSCKRCYFALPKKLGKGGIENVKEVLIFHFNNRGWYSLKEKIAKSGCPPQKG